MNNLIRRLLKCRYVPLVVLLLAAGCQAQSQTPSSADLVLVENGRARAVVVTADAPNPIVELAVTELLEHVELATGVTLEVVPESAAPEAGSASRIFIGETAAAAGLGIDSERLANDVFVFRTAGNDLYVLGRENDQEYHPRSMRNGTLFGVYEVIERALGVKWLWPGELGRHVPAAATVTLAVSDEEIAPALKSSYYRIEHIGRAVRDYRPEVERLAFSREGLDNYHRDVQAYLRRHRIGFREPRGEITADHYFAGWWQRYGEDHPDWFKMNAEGERVGPTMCVSNRELQRYIAEEVWDGEARRIPLGEVDRRVYCHCDDCMAWDQPLPEGWPTEGPNRVISNRYARFAAVVRDLARARRPEADFNVTFFVYFNYFHAPTIDIDLSNTIANFCPWFSGFNPWYPMPEDEHQRFMETWLGWRQTGMDLVYRPNYLLSGYVMPHLSTWQTGEMFRHAAQHDMRGCDFDSLWAHWAVKGPMYYVHMRLTSDPERTVAEIRDEYFAGFGPAASLVEQYFDYWEEYSANEASRGGGGWDGPWRAGRIYPEASFAPAVEMLTQAAALTSAAGERIYRERVAFLEAGLEHARLAARFTRTLGHNGRAPLDSRTRFEESKAKLSDLLQFRRDHEHLYIADYIAAAFVENRRIQIEPYFDENLEFPDDSEDDAVPLAEPWDSWHFRPDPEDRGVEQRWFAADPEATPKGLREYDDGAGQAFEINRQIWTPVTVPALLAETPIGAYLGYGWYATKFAIPDDWAGQSLVFHFTAVDEQAWIYVNGEYIGEHTVESEGLPIGDLWDRAFTVTAPAGLIRAGEENLLVVRKHSSAGASGIWGPVGLAPAD